MKKKFIEKSEVVRAADNKLSVLSLLMCESV